MISAPQPEAVEAGLEIFKAGGNVVDAAIAAAMVQTVVDPQMCGIAGFGAMQIMLPIGSMICIAPNPAIPHICGSTTVCTIAAAIAASTTFPPALKISSPASTASGCGAEIIHFVIVAIL